MSIEELRRIIVQLLADFHLGPRPTEGDGYGTINLSRALADALHPILVEEKPSEPSPVVVAEAVSIFVQHNATDVREMTKRLDWLLKTGRIE